jgi:hypothetical protein
MRINARVKQALDDGTLHNLLGGKKIYFQDSPDKKYPYITFFCYSEKGELYADNIEIATSFYIQVDVWSKTDYTEIVGLVNELMKNAGFRRTTAADLYEQDTGVFHKGMRFYYLYNKEVNVN